MKYHTDKTIIRSFSLLLAVPVEMNSQFLNIQKKKLTSIILVNQKPTIVTDTAIS